jgi:ribosomal protein L40E
MSIEIDGYGGENVIKRPDVEYIKEGSFEPGVICEKCREYIPSDAKKCPKCGHAKEKEIINHPSHYAQGENDPYEVIKIIEHYSLGFNLGNLIKYALRAGKKDPSKHVEDLKKAAWYLDREIKNLEKT